MGTNPSNHRATHMGTVPDATGHARLSPTSLLTHPTDGSSGNCLAQALQAARDGWDEVVFLSAPRDRNGPGHVVLRDKRTGSVREAAGPDGPARPEVYGARRILAVVEAAVVRSVLRRSYRHRRAALKAVPVLAEIGHLSFGIFDNIGNFNPPPPVPGGKRVGSTTDPQVSSWLNAMGDAVSQRDKAAVQQTSTDANTVLKWMQQNRGKDLKDAPKDVAEAKGRLLANDATAKRVTTDGAVSADALGQFIGDMDTSAGNAKSSWDAFKADNPGAGPVTTEEAANTSLIQGEMPILDAAGSSKAAVDGQLDGADIKAALNKGNAALPDALKHAASFYSNAGEFRVIDTAGDTADLKPDGIVVNSNLDHDLAHDSNKSEADMIGGLKSAAMQQVVADGKGDATKVNGDYFKDPSKSKATGPDKLAAMVQLSQTLGKLQAGQSQFKQGGPGELHDDNQYHQYNGSGPSPKDQRDAFAAEVQKRITTLSGDKDVQGLLNDKLPGALQNLVKGDPGMKAALGANQQKAAGTQALTDAFAQKGPDGKPVSTADALNSFVSKAGFYDNILGGGAPAKEVGNKGLGATHAELTVVKGKGKDAAGGMEAPPAQSDLAKALAGAPQAIKDKVTQGYKDLTSGKTIDDAVKGGASPQQAVAQAAASKYAYDRVLDPKTVADGDSNFNKALTDRGTADVLSGVSADDIFKGLGVKDLNDPKLKQLVESQMQQLTGTTQKDASAMTSDIISTLGGVVRAVRSGEPAVKALQDLRNDLGKATQFPKDDPLTKGTYKPGAMNSGVLHAASALFIAGGLGSKLAGGGQSPLDKAGDAGSLLGIAGLLTDGKDKLNAGLLNPGDPDGKSAVPGATGSAGGKNPYQPFESTSFEKYAKDVGKISGFAGSAIGFVTGAIGAAQANQAGQKDVAAAQGVVAGLGGLDAVVGGVDLAGHLAGDAISASAVEGATSLASRLFGLAGPIGSIVGAVSGLAAIGVGIFQGVKDGEKYRQDTTTWMDDLTKGFAPSGVDVPPLQVLTGAPHGKLDTHEHPGV